MKKQLSAKEQLTLIDNSCKDVKNLDGSLEQSKLELRDAYMNFKDLQTKCIVDMKQQPTIGQEEHTVYYFKPDTFLLDDPEKQRLYRDSLIKKVSSIPTPEPVTYMGDDLHRQMCQTIADRSQPKQSKQFLKEFFMRRQYTLQHMKYKLLCRWAHINLTSDRIENVSMEATYIYGKLAYNLEQSVQRQERLNQDDYYDHSSPESRPSTKTEEGGSALYVEKFDLKPQSLIREDDIEVYIRQVSYKNKVSKLVNKFIARLKWLPQLHKEQIFQKSIESYFEVKQKNIDQQNALYQRVQDRGDQYCPNKNELQEVLDNYYCKIYEKMFSSGMDKVLFYWKANHDEAPRLVNDVQLLKIKILDNAKLFGVSGDIEMDHGYNFSYQVSILFPSYFQQQILKTQFSIYDKIAGESKTEQMRNALNTIKVDSNIFRDLSTLKGNVPNDDAIAAELKYVDIKVIRLKSAKHWIDYIALTPSEPEWHQKQQAILHCDNPIDSLLVKGMNFLDVNDIATINRVNEDNAHLHISNIQRLKQHNPHDKMVKKVISTTTDKQGNYVNIDTKLNDQASLIETHLYKAVQTTQDDDQLKSSKLNTLMVLPTHLLTAFYTLRYMKSRDAKQRLLYCLNYYRAIQKRLALDLREFATRDRLDAHLVNPFVQSKEANSTIINNAAFQSKAYDHKLTQRSTDSDEHRDQPNMTVFDEDAIKKIQNMAGLRAYKNNGVFNAKVFSTCPTYPKFHAANGEPIVRMTEDEENDRNEGSKSMTERSVKLMGRIEFIEINETRKEVYVRDDFGIYIMHDCVLQDMKSLEDDLCQIGSFYINKGEVLLDPTLKHGGTRPLPARDRLEVIQDLLELEQEFQFQKVKLTQVYMECYEHITDPVEQQKLMQIITDIMARRPRLNLSANYFKDAYLAEIVCIQKQFDLVRQIVDMQISLEKAENARLQESLNLSYSLANQYSQNKWAYQDAESLLSEIKKSQKHTDEPAQIQTPKVDPSEESDVQSNYGQEETKDFTALLGLPQITLETIYQSYKEKDLSVIKLMAEHSHFIELHEGYPEFITRLTHKAILDNQRTFKVNSWSQETGSLDFYETLDFITKLYVSIQVIQSELYDILKPWDASLMSHIDLQVAEICLQEFRKVIKFQEGQDTDYEGRHLVEDEQIMGNSDKVIYYAKSMLSELNFTPKEQLDPFIIAKLDLSSINYFDFPKLPKALNKYQQRSKGIAGLEFAIQAEKNAIVGVAKAKVDKTSAEVQNLLNQKVTDILGIRNLVVPSLLKVYCNMMELYRLRNEIILAATETQLLEEIYATQCKMAGFKSCKVLLEEGIPFDIPTNTDFVNYFDDGCASGQTIGLAIREFDPALLSNFNFRNPDSLRLNILTSGLEEVRAILQYQLFQKHLLIVATRINSLLIDTHSRALSELYLLDKHRIAVPNPVIAYSKLINKNFDQINASNVKMEIQQYKQNLSSCCQPVLYQIVPKKQMRTTIAKQFQDYYARMVNKMPHSENAVLRVSRCYKVKLLTLYVQNQLNEVYLDAQKFQAIASCQRLRTFNRYFGFDAKKMGLAEGSNAIFKYETNKLLENFANAYLPTEFNLDADRDSSFKKTKAVTCIDSQDYLITDYFGIPSTFTLLSLDAASQEDTRLFRQKRLKIRVQIGQTDNEDIKTHDVMAEDPEVSLKNILPTFTPELNNHKKSLDEIEQQNKLKLGRSAGEPLDYEEALYFGDSKYAQLTMFYTQLQRILMIEWFILKLQFRSDEVVHIESKIESGCQFWTLDDFDNQIQELVQHHHQEGLNQRAQKYFSNKIISLKEKRNFAQQLCSLGLTMKSFISQVAKTKPDLKQNYITQYCEFRYQQVVGSMHKLVEQYYYSKNLPAVISLKSAIAQLTNMNHVKVIFYKPNNYSVQTCVAAPEHTIIESSNLVYGSVQYDEVINFQRCVQPVINEKALEPAQVSLFQSMYNHDQYRRSYSVQFAGQATATFRAFNYLLLMMSPDERQYCQSFISQAKFQANDFMETVFNDTTMASITTEEVYNYRQLVDAKKFINESTQALLLKNALMCWQENAPLPNDIERYQQFDSNFKTNYFWKLMEQKEELTSKLEMMSQFGSIPTKEELQKIKQKIDDLVNNHSLATESQVSQRDELVKALRQEFQSLKKKVTLDNYFTTKAQNYLFVSELEKLLIRASIQTLDSECNSIAKCFTMQVPSLQYHIHPFQQFAATFYDQVDPNSHLCVSHKVTAVQALITKLRNRCTQIETLTSGPGIVFTIKDINDILLEFCRTSIKDQEIQFKSRQETAFIMEAHLKDLLYAKDQQIKSLEHRIQSIGDNLDSIIDARLFEKGNQLVYELDSSNRVLKLFKNSMHDLEQFLALKINEEQFQKFARKNNELTVKDIRFNKYKETIMNMIGLDFAEEQDRIKEVIKQKAENAKLTGTDVPYKPVAMYGTGIVPKGFEHYTFCSCYKPNPKHPQPTLELAELEMLSEAEARRELRDVCILLRKQRVLWMTKDMLRRSKLQDQVNSLKQQLTNNSHLWDQLAQSEQREKILKQELTHTQQAWAESERQILCLKEDIKIIDAEKSRLQNFKTSRVEKFKELEIKVHKYDLMEKINTEQLLSALVKKDAQLKQVEGLQGSYLSKIEHAERKTVQVKNQLEKKYLIGQMKTQQIVDKMDQMKLELRMLETNDSSVASIWKKKCLDLFEVCQAMKNENEELRDRCKDLIEQGMLLAEAVKHDDQAATVVDEPIIIRPTVLTPIQVETRKSIMTTSRGKTMEPVEKPPTIRNAAKQDIRSILSDTNPIVMRKSAVSSDRNNALKKRQNYMQQQDSIFNQSQATQGRNIMTAEHGSLRARKAQQIASLDLKSTQKSPGVQQKQIASRQPQQLTDFFVSSLRLTGNVEQSKFIRTLENSQ